MTSNRASCSLAIPPRTCPFRWIGIRLRGELAFLVARGTAAQKASSGQGSVSRLAQQLQTVEGRKRLPTRKVLAGCSAILRFGRTQRVSSKSAHEQSLRARTFGV